MWSHGVLVFAALLSLAGGFSIRLLGASDGMVTGALLDSVLLSLPPCTFGGRMANLMYMNMATNVTTYQANAFQVPQCRTRRSLITVTQNNGQYISTSAPGYQVKGLTSGTTYSFQYIVGQNTSDVLQASTMTASPYTNIDDGLPARSGAMLVITVILSVAMFILVAALVATVVSTHCMS